MPSDRAVRPAFITTVPYLGGAELGLLRLIKEQRREGIHPAVVVVHSGDGLSELYRSANLPVSEFTLHRWQLGRPWRYCQSLLQLAYPIIEHRANLIHISHHYGLAFTVQAARLSRRPFLIHVRGVESEEWVAENLRFLESAARIIAVSEAVKRRLTSCGVLQERIEVVYDGVDLAELGGHRSLGRGALDDLFARGESGKLIGIVGRVVPLKGIEDFLQAVAILSPDVPELHAVVVGTGPPEYARVLKQLAARLGIDGRVKFIGHRQDVAKILAQLDVLVLATHDREMGREEACPNIVLEAMACRTPVVATRSGGVVELLADDRGVTATPGDAADLVRGILRVLCMRDDERVAMLDRARGAVERHFTIQEHSRQILGLYAEVLEGQRSA